MEAAWRRPFCASRIWQGSVFNVFFLYLSVPEFILRTVLRLVDRPHSLSCLTRSLLTETQLSSDLSSPFFTPLLGQAQHKHVPALVPSSEHLSSRPTTTSPHTKDTDTPHTTDSLPFSHLNHLQRHQTALHRPTPKPPRITVTALNQHLQNTRLYPA